VNSLDTLIRMANQIAANLMHETDPAAVTAEHIQLYWDPRMKTMIRGEDVTGLSDTARAAINQLR
jgi:formate dehydrogenase subunit delta